MTAAIVLAGGKSRRFGRDKASERVHGRPLLQHVLDRLRPLVQDTVVVRARGQSLPALDHPQPRVVKDAYPDAGPLGGIVTGLAAVSSEAALVAACDMPLLQPPLLAELLRLLPGHDAVVPLVGEELQPQPLCAAYSRDCLPNLEAKLRSGQLTLIPALDGLDVLYLPPEGWQPFDPEGLSFQNVNRPEDLALVEPWLRP